MASARNRPGKQTDIRYNEMPGEVDLPGWGQWARSGETHLGYPPSLLQFTAKWTQHSSHLEPASITEDRAESVESFITELPITHRLVIVAIYRQKIPWRRLPYALQMPRSRIEAYHNQALGMLWEKMKKHA